MTTAKSRIKINIRFTRLLLIALFAFAVCLGGVREAKATSWQNNPNSCPIHDDINYPAQHCGVDVMCGVSTGIVQCITPGAISVPVASTTSATLYSALYGGGYVLDCQAASDAAAPYCDNNTAAWCNRDATCFGGGNNRLTTCVGGKWQSAAGAFTCGACLATHLDCLGDTKCEVQKNTTDYPTGTNNHYGTTCLAPDVRCDAGIYDCDATGVTVGNGCEATRTGACVGAGGFAGTWSCSVNAGGSCSDGGSNYDCSCTAPKCDFWTGDLCSYLTSNPLLWGRQYGTGDLIRMGNTATSSVFVVHNDGTIEMATTTAPADVTNQLYNLNGDLYWSGVLLAAGATTTSSTESLQTVTDRGNTTTNTIQFNGATSTNNFLPGTDDSYSLGLASLRWRNLYLVNLFASGTSIFNNIVANNVTTTNLVATGTTTLNTLIVNSVSTTSITINGTTVTSVASTLQDVTNNGNVTTKGIQFAGGTSTGNFQVLGTGSQSAQISINADDGSGTGRNAYLVLNGDGLGGGEAAILMQSNGTQFGQLDGSGAAFRIISNGASDLIFGTQSFNALFSESTGRLGLGTQAPSSTLHVYSRTGTSTTPLLTLQNTVGGYQTFVTNLDPNGVVVGDLGDLAVDSVNGRLYIKETGSGTNLGWSAFATGTVSGGALNFQQVTDNGNYTTNTIQFAGGTSTGQFIVNTMLGIGTSHPYYSLDVNSESSIQSVWRNAAGEGVMMVNSNTGDELGLVNYSGDGVIAAVSKNDTGLFYYGNRVLNVNSTLNRVGIGTTTPATMLHLQGGLNGGAIIRLDADDGSGSGVDAAIVMNADYINGGDAANIRFLANGTETGQLFSSGGGESGFRVAGLGFFSINTAGQPRFTVDTTGGVAISPGVTADPSAIFDVSSNDRGVLLPRMLVAQRNAIAAPIAGLILFNRTSSTFDYFDGVNWVSMATGTGSSSALNFQQVTDNGNSTTNKIQFAGGTSTGSLVPGSHNVYSLGTSANRWSDLWASSLHVGTSTWDLAQSTNGSFTIGNSGNERMRIGTNGYVSVGTTTTMNNGLYVYGSKNFTSFGITIENDPAIAGASALSLKRGIYTATLGYAGINNELQLNTPGGSNSAVSIGANGNVGVYISKNGNVGIGTAPPDFKLQVAGHAGPQSNNTFDLGSATTSWRNIYASGFVSTTALYINGQLVPTTTGASNLQQVTDVGNVTTKSMQFAGGTSTASFGINGSLSIGGIRLDSMGTNATTSGAYLSGVYDNFTNFHASTVQEALKAIDMLLLTGGASSSDSYFVGLSTASYNGAFSAFGKVGYQAANAVCDADYAGSHFCRTDEVIGTIADKDISALFISATYGWIAEGPPGYTANSNDCTGYTTSNNIYLGAFWAYEPVGGGAGWLNNCSVLRKISCCKK